jgi:hypothetical protein
MAIPEPYRRNFETLRRAALQGDLALMEWTDAASGTARYVVCAVGRADNGDYVMTPFGHLCDENPYEIYLPPTGGTQR